jgi:hypothetical protein
VSRVCQGAPSRSELGKAVCKVLGLDPDAVHSLVIHLEAGDAAMLDVCLYPTSEQSVELALLFQCTSWVPVHTDAVPLLVRPKPPPPVTQPRSTARRDTGSNP